MKYLLISLLAVFSFQTLSAQEFDVREFNADPSDLAARRNEKRTVNDEPCALIKINTNIKGMQFDSNIGIVDVVHQDDGYWVYVAPRERRIRLMANGFLSLDVNMPEPARSHIVYILIVAPKGVVVTSDLVKITFRMNESNVYIRSGNTAPILQTSNTAVIDLAKGAHTLTFFKEGFNDKELKINADKAEAIDVTLEPGATTSKLALSGWIVVSSEPSGAEVYFNDQRVGVTDNQFRQIAGIYNLRIQYPLYYDHNEQFTLSEGATVNLPLIKLKPRFGYWQVNTTPTGAEVLLDSKPVGTTPLARGQISSGMHELIVRKSLYHDHKETFTIEDGDDKNFNISLKPAFGELEVTSDPTGAKVFVDEREVGTTPYRNPQQPSGNYRIRLAKNLYSDARDNINVSDGQKTEKFIALSKNYGTLNVTASGAEIFFNNSRVGSNSYNANIPPGQYKVKATRDKHHDDEREVFIVLGQTETITLNPKPKQGGVSISSTPFDARGAEIFINNEKRKETTPTTIPLLIGSYNITVKKSGFLDASQSVVVREGQEQELIFAMQTFSGSLQEQANRYKRAKIVYGLGTIAAAGAGAYFRYSTITLYDDYKVATTDATAIFDKMEQHDLYSWASFGVAVPLGVMTIVKAVQQKKSERKITTALLPTRDGALFGLAINF
ncbi:MAG: PEGA domain-containing protein [Tenuifilaceae bacterium]|jgi:hypothetical protein|nr:PEGA domain-containing protein [Tenuifilaceae bacterium]